MKHEITSRGFKHMEPLEGTNAETVRVYESSRAASPHIWLAITNPLTGSETHAHLTIETATELRDQLNWLIDNHYQLYTLCMCSCTYCMVGQHCGGIACEIRA